MKFKMALELVRRYKYYITYEDFGKALSLSTAGVKKRISRDSDLKYDECFVLAKHFELPVRLFFKIEDIPDTLPIDYYENDVKVLQRRPNMKYYNLDFDAAYDYRKTASKDDFRIICMIGDKLAGGRMWMRNGDVLLLDITRTDINDSGYYAYECDGGKYVAMADITAYPDEVHFRFYNPDKVEKRSWEWLKEKKFKPIGRIVKNVYYFA